MKLRTSRMDRANHPLGDATDAIAYACGRAVDMRDGGGELERMRWRCDALENITGRLLDAMIANGLLRAEQVSQIFDYDVIAGD